jgi:hypothetical protein
LQGFAPAHNELGEIEAPSAREKKKTGWQPFSPQAQTLDQSGAILIF